jgi:hypothetical protein
MCTNEFDHQYAVPLSHAQVEKLLTQAVVAGGRLVPQTTRLTSGGTPCEQPYGTNARLATFSVAVLRWAAESFATGLTCAAYMHGGISPDVLDHSSSGPALEG